MGVVRTFCLPWLITQVCLAAPCCSLWKEYTKSKLTRQYGFLPLSFLWFILWIGHWSYKKASHNHPLTGWKKKTMASITLLFNAIRVFAKAIAAEVWVRSCHQVLNWVFRIEDVVKYMHMRTFGIFKNSRIWFTQRDRVKGGENIGSNPIKVQKPPFDFL